MQHKQNIKALVCLSLISGLAQASTLGSQTITTSLTPTVLACSPQRYVNKLTIRVIPGYTGKVFVGTYDMETVGYRSTIKILFPNLGAHSAEYVLQDPGGDDGIDLCTFYVVGGVAGEKAIAEYSSNGNGTTAPTYLLSLAVVGPVTNGTVSVDGTTIASAQVIPGYTNGAEVNFTWLDANTGVLSQHNAWSESWQQIDPLGRNGLLGSMGIAGDPLLVAIWRKDGPSGPPTPAVSWTLGFCGSAVGTGVAPLFNCVSGGGKLSDYANGVYGLNWKVAANINYWPKVDVQDSGGNLFAELWPNTTKTGFSEGINFGVGRAGSGSDLYAVAATVGRGDFVTPTAGVSSIPAVLSTAPTIVAGAVGSSSGVAIGRGNVKKLRIQVTPGYVGKIYIGNSSMNTTTFAGVGVILFPNSVGRWSETFEHEDPEGDGIPTNDIYIKADVPGEQALVFTSAVGITPADGVLSVKAIGAVSGSGGTSAVRLTSSSTPAAYVRAQAIPGGSGKLWVGTADMLTAAQPDANYAGVLKVLWPSQGDYNVGEGWSERFTQSCPASAVAAPNCLDLHDLTFWPYVSSEQLLVFALGR